MKPQKTDLHASLRLLICLLSLKVSVQSGKKPVSIFRRIKISPTLNCNLGSIISKELFKGNFQVREMKLDANFLLIRQRVVHQQSAKMTNQFLPRLFVGISRILIDDPPPPSSPPKSSNASFLVASCLLVSLGKSWTYRNQSRLRNQCFMIRSEWTIISC